MRRLGRDLPGDLERRVLEFRDRDDLLHEPPLVRGRRVDELAGQVEEHRAADPGHARQPLRAAAARDQAQLDLRLAQPCVVGAHADVAAQS